MEKVQDIKGLGGMLNGFRDLVKDDAKITFIGSSGFCTPFALFLGYPVKEKQLAFMPGLRGDKTRTIIATDYGLELGDNVSPDADAVVILGGMAMSKIGVKAEDLNAALSKISYKKLIGVCFMGIFERSGWCQTVGFDYIMNLIVEGDISKK